MIMGHSTEVAFALLTQLPQVRYLAFPKIQSSALLRHCSVPTLNNVD